LIRIPEAHPSPTLLGYRARKDANDRDTIDSAQGMGTIDSRDRNRANAILSHANPQPE
jgi:hypothetical protein